MATGIQRRQSLDGAEKVFSGQSGCWVQSPLSNTSITNLYRYKRAVSQCEAADGKVTSVTRSAGESCWVQRRQKGEGELSPAPLPACFSLPPCAYSPCGKARSVGDVRIHVPGAERCSSRGAAAEAGPCSGAIPGSSSDSLPYPGQSTPECV